MHDRQQNQIKIILFIHLSVADFKLEGQNILWLRAAKTWNFRPIQVLPPIRSAYGGLLLQSSLRSTFCFHRLASVSRTRGFLAYLNPEPETPHPTKPRPYSKPPKKLGSRIKDNSCWDSRSTTLKDSGFWVSNFRASTVNPKP